MKLQQWSSLWAMGLCPPPAYPPTYWKKNTVHCFFCCCPLLDLGKIDRCNTKWYLKSTDMCVTFAIGLRFAGYLKKVCKKGLSI